MEQPPTPYDLKNHQRQPHETLHINSTTYDLPEYRKLRNLTYCLTMTSLLKQWGNLDLRETREIIYHSKGNDESFQNM